MEWKPKMWPTFAAEVLAARASLRLGDEVGLAVRAERHRLGLSQRAYAVHRGWTLGTVIRLETAADAVKLGDVVDALSGTPFQLCLCHRPPDHEPGVAAQPRPDPAPDYDTGPPPGATSSRSQPAGPTTPDRQHLPAADPPAPQPVHPAFWPRAELIARVRGGGRRFPAHHVTEQVGWGPPWWWYAESSQVGTVPPDWYAPQYTQRRPTAS
jgi:hypothetical protein